MGIKIKIILVLLLSDKLIWAWTGHENDALTEPATNGEIANDVDNEVGGALNVNSVGTLSETVTESERRDVNRDERRDEERDESSDEGSDEDPDEPGGVHRVTQELLAHPRHNFLVAPMELEKLLRSQLRAKAMNDDREIEENRVMNENREMKEDHESSEEDGTENNILEDALTSNPIRVSTVLVEDRNRRRGNSSSSVGQLVQRVTLQSRWAFNFQKRDTHKHLFYDTPHTHVYADSMCKDDIFQFAVLEELNATALELPLQVSSGAGLRAWPGSESKTKTDNLRMLLLLPDAMDGLASLERQLGDDWRSLERVTRRLRPTLVRVFMPKFKVVYRLAAKRLFDEESSFAGQLANVWQEAQIKVTEDGIGELERQTVLFWNAYSSLRTTPQRFDMNHPFLFAVRNTQGVQFIGHLAKL